MLFLSPARARVGELVLMALLAASGALPAFAIEVHHFDIAEEDAAAAIRDFGEQAHVQILVAAEAVKGKKLHAVTGELSTEDGLTALLSGSGLTHRYVGDHSIALLAQATQASTRSQVDGPGGADPGTQEGKKDSSGNFLLAQATPGQAVGDVSVDNKEDTSKHQDTLQEVHPNIPEILIQGSKVMNVDVKRTNDDAQPYYILDSKQIEQSGATNVEDFLKQQLTMNTSFGSSSQGYGSLNGASSSINLRGLGANETLILIDGRRSAGVSLLGTAYQTDINGIPLSAIERIEVLPSSASAIYGGAAVGGVVNIILKKNFQGGDISAVYENTTDGSAPLRTLSATYGFSLEDGKTRIMLSGRYSDAQPLVIQDRPNLVERGIATILNNSPSYFYNSANPFPGATTNIAGTDANGNPTNLFLKDGTPLNSPITFVPAGAAPGSNLSAGLLANAGKYNLNLAPSTGQYGLQNAIGAVPLDKSFMATIRREVSSALEVFTEFSTFTNSSRESYNPFGGTYSIPSTAPDNPFQQGVTVTFPSTLSAPLTTDSVTQSLTTGLLAHLPGDWQSELDYTWSRNLFEYASPSSDSGDLTAALAAGTLNPFADTIAHPLDLAPYLTTLSVAGDSTLDDLGLRASGSVGSLPWGQPTLTIGLEHRKEGSQNGNLQIPMPLAPVNTDDILYFGQSQSTNSAYAETQIPLVTSQNTLPLIHSLDMQLAGRSERYTVYAGTPSEILSPAYLQFLSPPQGAHATISYTSTNPTIGLKYRPTADVLFRASYSKAFLPPTAAQFLPNHAPACPVACTLITDPENGETYNVNYTQGGNPNLKPQTSKDWDLGVIWEPQEEVFKGLRMDLEYYTITQPNYITSPTAQQVVSNPAFASRVTRDPTTGLITTVDLSYLNAEQYQTDGWDLALDYRKPTVIGIFDLHAVGTVIEHDRRQYTIGGAFLDYVGYPSEGGEAKAKANTSLTWEYRHWTLAWTTIYYGSYRQGYGPGSPDAFQSGANFLYVDAQGGNTIPSQTYHNLVGSYSFDSPLSGRGQGDASSFTSRALSGLTIQFGIKNLFNTPPPFDAFSSPYFYSPYGDPRLRDYWISIRKSFL
jgi:iron complex outermembrane receptor protein